MSKLSVGQLTKILNENRFNKILCGFNAIYDYDDAILNFVLRNYPRSKYIIEDAYNYTPFYRHYLLSNRRSINPLSVIFKKEYSDKIDGLFKEIIEDNRDKLLDYIKPTDMLRTLDLVQVNSGYEIYIECFNKKEKNIISKANLICSKVNIQDTVDEYFTCVFKDAARIDKLSKYPQGKTMYFWDYFMNYDNSIENDKGERSLSSSILSLMTLNVVKLITPYQDMEDPIN